MNKTLSYNGVEMLYSVTGQGDSDVILMHGWGCSKETVESIRAVAARSHRVLTVDFPGHGGSSEPPLLEDGNVWGVEHFTRLIEHLAVVEGVKNPILIGHSFGGRVAILYASRHADVSRVVLVDAAGVKPRRPLSYYYKVYSFKLAKRLALTFLGKEHGGAVVDRMRARRGSADYSAASVMMRRVLSRVVNEDLCHAMPLIKAPTLLLWGEADTATPLADAQRMERLIPDAGLVSWPGCGHYSFLDNPTAFAAVLHSFINT